MAFKVDTHSAIPVYKQLIQTFEADVKSGELVSGDFLPSMNSLSIELGISKDTVKKAYNILRQMNYIDSSHGKGFYVTNKIEANYKALVIFDSLTNFKLLTYQELSKAAGGNVEVNVTTHDQSIEKLAQIIDNNIEGYDYFIIAAHFRTDKETYKELVNLLKRIPNRKLIVLDKQINELSGKYACVYQDFENDSYFALQDNLALFQRYTKINVICSKNSLYSDLISKGISKFCKNNNMKFKLHAAFDADKIKHKEVYVILDRQLDKELFDILRAVKKKQLKLGEDIGVVSFNESPVNEFILDGLTVLSTDFEAMGRLAGEMIKSKKFTKIKNNFSLIVRSTL